MTLGQLGRGNPDRFDEMRARLRSPLLVDQDTAERRQRPYGRHVIRRERAPLDGQRTADRGFTGWLLARRGVHDRHVDEHIRDGRMFAPVLPETIWVVP